MTKYSLTVASLALFMLFASMPALAQECAPGVSVGTDQDAYFQADQVMISGQILDQDCGPVPVQDGIGIVVLLPSGTQYFVDQIGTNDLGEFGTSFKLPAQAALGEWTVYAAYGGEWDSGTFIVTDEDCLEGDTRQCGSTSEGACSFGIETCSSGEWGGCTAVLPAAEACGNGLDDDCDGATDEDCSTSKSSSSGGGGTCLPKYECSEWSSCQPDGTQARDCERIAGCGTSSAPPNETQACDYSSGSGSEACEESWSCSDWSSCEDNVQARACTDASSCGTTADKPLETQSCEAIQESAANPGDGVTGFAIGEFVSAYGLVILLLVLIVGAGAWKVLK